MKKKIFYIIMFIVIFVGLIFRSSSEDSNTKVITYNGDNLRISIDGVSSNTLPTNETYYLTDYECSNKNTEVTWDNANHKLNISNGTKKAGVACYLEFKSNPLLSEMPVGSYVKYVGDNGCSGKACEGQNANYVSDTDMGYCDSTSYKFYVNGWRIGYIENGSVSLISAGAPECMCSFSDGSFSNSSCTGSLSENDIGKHYTNMDNIALKYCNSDYIKGGICGIEDAHAMDAEDFKRITGSTLSSSSCYGSNFSSDMSCGYSNDLIDNGGYYWFATNESSSNSFAWRPYSRGVLDINSFHLNGVRPVLNLESSIIVTGGDGTYKKPYEISNNYFRINDGASYLNASDNLSNVQLSLNATGDVSKMCISVNTSVCTNYVNYSDTYTLNWSSEPDGEKIVYVYYKDSDGNIVSSLNRSIIVDTTAPTNNSVVFNETDGMLRTLTISSTGASHMCFSNTSNDYSLCNEWVDYATSINWKLNEGIGGKNIYGFFKDDVGNIASVNVSTTCTNDCEYKYFMDAYNNSSIYLMRNDGATALVSTGSNNLTWYTSNSQIMKVCGAYNRSSSARIWCIGNDNNAYYKTGYSATSWNKVNVSSYIDTSTYSYSIIPYSTTYAYIVRSDGKINRLDTSKLQVSSPTWTYGYATNMLKCSGTYYSSSAIRITCIGKDGYYYYRADYDTTTSYTKSSSILKLNTVNDNNSWIDMYSNTSTDIIQTDGTNMYNSRFTYNSSPSWVTSNVPGGGVKTCTSAGNTTSNYCIGNDNLLYYKSNTATNWSSTSLSVS